MTAITEIALLGKEVKQLLKQYNQKELRFGRVTVERAKFMLMHETGTEADIDMDQYHAKLQAITAEKTTLLAEMDALLPELITKSEKLQAHMILAGELDNFVTA